MNDYRVKITIRNDRMLSAMEKMGYSSVASFCKKFFKGKGYYTISKYFSGNSSALNVHGELKEEVKELLTILDLTPEEAFTKRQLHGFKKISFEVKTSEEALLSMTKPPIKNLESTIMEKETHKILDGMLDKLKPREAKAIKYRYNIEDCPYTTGKIPTWDEIGLCFMVTRERARQIYKQGVRKLRTTKNIELINNASETRFNLGEMNNLQEGEHIKRNYNTSRNKFLRSAPPGSIKVLKDGSVQLKSVIDGEISTYKNGEIV
jgi:hypothetical protein